MPVTVSNLLSGVLKRPVIILPLLILVNIFVIHFYGIPIFEQSTDDRMSLVYKMKEPIQEDQLSLSRRRNVERLRNISRVCNRYNRDESFRELGMIGTALATQDKRLFYCFVPKVGCTYWKRVMRFISNDYNRHLDRPEDIPRLFAHLGPYRNTTVIQLLNESTTDALDHKFKFMFTRDPYERLWSGYLDKMFLPDFWWWLGTKIINATRPHATEHSISCGDDVSFEEFLLYTINKLKSGERVNIHFAPVYTQCNPCVIKFDVVGKLETFQDDTNLILQETHSGVGKTGEIAKDRIIEEIQTLIKYNFDILDRLKQKSGNSDCYSSLTVAQRLWKTFQYHGYISERDNFPPSVKHSTNDLTVLRRSLTKRIMYLRKMAGSEAEKWKYQRQKYLKIAYQSVPSRLLKAIEQTYKGDFELFGYEKRSF